MCSKLDFQCHYSDQNLRFRYIINVIFGPFNESLLNKSIHLFKKSYGPETFNEHELYLLLLFFMNSQWEFLLSLYGKTQTGLQRTSHMDCV